MSTATQQTEEDTGEVYYLTLRKSHGNHVERFLDQESFFDRVEEIQEWYEYFTSTNYFVAATG